MSVQPVNLHLGPGELFFKRDTDTSGKYMRVGSVKEAATFEYELETVEQQPGNRLTVARRDKISEKARLTVQLVDFKIAQLIAAFGLSISSTQITITSTLRVWEELAFGSTTTTKTLNNTAVSTTSVVVTKLDQSVKYAKATAFTVPSTTKIRALQASLANTTAFVAYDSKDTAAGAIRIGDKLKLQVVDLKFSTRMSDGKFITIEIPRATIMGGFEIPFSFTEYTMYELTFEALGDTTAAPGRSLFNIIREA